MDVHTDNIHGVTDEGNWLVYSRHARTIGGEPEVSFGPFRTRAEVEEFLGKVDGGHLVAVNLSDYPRWFNY